MPLDLQVRSVSVRFSPVRYLRFRSRVLTASRRITQVRAAGVSLSPEEIVEVFQVDKRAAADLNERQLFYSETLGQPSSLPALTASPRPRRYDPRSQAFSPYRGGDPGIRGRRNRHREPAPAERAAAAARSRVSPDPHLLALPLTVRPRRRRPRGPAGSAPEHLSQQGPTSAVVLCGTDGRR